MQEFGIAGTQHCENFGIVGIQNYGNKGMREIDHPIFRNGANPGFPEAVGDVISLVMRTPTYLKSLNLVGKFISIYNLKEE